MARKTKIIDIPPDPNNRDGGKRFIIREMPASQAERWANRALQAVASSGVSVPEVAKAAGMEGLMIVGLQAVANLPWEVIGTFLDEMFSSCVSVVPDVARPGIVRGPPAQEGSVGPLIEDDIEEVYTRMMLRAEVFTLHTGFSLAGGGLTSDPQTPPAPPSV